MAIDFQQQRDNLVEILTSNVSRSVLSISDMARQFTTWYDEMIKKSGQDALYGNAVVQANVNAFQSALVAAFQSAASSTVSINAQIATAFQTAVIGYWTGARLETTMPPPPSTQVVSNAIVNPGTFQTTIPTTSDTIQEFVENSLITPIQAHLATVSGITTGLTPQPTGAPIPVPYPFQGYI